MKNVNQERLLSEDFPERRVVEKVMLTLPEKYDDKISLLEDAWDLSKCSLTKHISALQAVEQRKDFREESSTERALVASQKAKV